MDGDLLITLIFAAVAVFVIFKLRSVLGTRTGFEKKRDPFAPAETRDARDNVVSLPERRPEPAPAADPRTPLDTGLAAIRRADASFDPERFVEGAKAAFEIIVTEYAAGNADKLKPLLAKDVMASFADAIRQREQAGHVLETKIVSIRTPVVRHAELRGREARVTVEIVSQQINVTKDQKSGALIEGDPKVEENVTDVWSFARDTRSGDPNWALAETGSSETR